MKVFAPDLAGLGVYTQIVLAVFVVIAVLSRIRKFVCLPPGDQWLFLQAWCLLGWYRFLIYSRPLKLITADLQQLPGEAVAAKVSDEELRRAKRISDAVAGSAVATPWLSSCLVQVLSLQDMLSSRGISGQFCIGATLDFDETDKLKVFSAHAWLQCGHKILNGGLSADKFSVLTTYRW